MQSWNRLDEDALERFSARDLDKKRLVLIEQVCYDLGRSASLEDVAHVLVDRGLPALGASAATLSLVAGDRATLEVVAAVGLSVEQLKAWEQLPLSCRVPAADAVTREHPVVAVHPGDAAERYPDLPLTEEGTHLVAGFPLRADDEVVGAVDARWELHAADPAVADLAASQRLSDVAGTQAHHQQLLQSLQRTTDQLQHALESRVLIEQAKGHLAERHGIDEDAAFERLRRHSRSHRARLRDVAAQVIESGLDPPG